MRDKIVTMWKNKTVKVATLVLAMILVAGAAIVPSVMKANAAEIAANQVADGMLDVKMQIQEVSGKLNMRLVSSVNGLGYSKVGFEIYFDANGDGAFDEKTEKVVHNTTTVLERINASKTGVTYKYSPKVIDTDSEYLITGTLMDINQAKKTNDFYVRAFVISLDGETTTYGTGRYFNIADATATGIVNIPVKDANASLTAGSTVEVTVAGVATTATVEANRDGYAHLNVTVPAAATVTATQASNKTLLPSASKIAVANSSLSAVYRNLESSYANKNGGDDSWYQIDPNASAFIIATDADLFGFSAVSQSTDDFSGQTVYQVADIVINEGTAASTGFTLAEGVTEKVWTPISPDTMPFAGIFDGQGHKIAGLKVGTSGTSTFVGVFGRIVGGRVKNLTIHNSYFAGKHQIGAVAGVADNAIVENVDVNAHIYGTGGHLGGFFGQHLADNLTMTDCHMLGGTVTSDAAIAGGLVGMYGAGTTIFADCSNGASVKAAGQIGGFVGRGQSSATIQIKASTNSGEVTSTGEKTGGFIGYTEGGQITIQNSVNTGTVSSNGIDVGGFVGHQVNEAVSVSITDSRNEGTVTSTSTGNSAIQVRVGGIAGYLKSGGTKILRCKNTGNISASSADYVGGLVGMADRGLLTVENSDNAGQTKGRNITGGIAGATWRGASIVDCSNTGAVTGTGNSIGGILGYGPSGDVSMTRVSNEAKVVGTNIMAGMVGQLGGVTFTATDCTNSGEIAGSTHSIGGFLGDSYGTVSISGSKNTGAISASSNSIGGFIGYIRSNGNGTTTISDSNNEGAISGVGSVAGFVGNSQRALTITGSTNQGNYSGTSTNVGGFVGYTNNTVTITNCENKGHLWCTASGDVNSGGFIGFAQGSTTVSLDECTNAGTVNTTAGSNIGGFIGKFDKTAGTLSIKNSENKGTITSKVSCAGGFVGILYGIVNIDNCKNNAAVTANSVGAAGFVAYQPTGSLTITNSQNEHAMDSTAQYTGGFVGYEAVYATIKNSTNSGAITSTKTETGGFVGFLNAGGLFEECVNKGTLTAATVNMAGFVGQQNNGAVQFKNSRNEANITNTSDKWYIGGFVGNARDTLSFTQCVNSGAVTGNGNQIGGFIGAMAPNTNTTLTLTITQCSNSGMVRGMTGNCGGFVGYIGSVPTVTVRESENSGEVVNATTASHTQYGGFVGWISGGSISFAQCLNSGKLTSTQNNIGGFIGTLDATLIMDGCLNVGLITGGTQKGAFVGNAKGSVTKTNVYASAESCDSVMYINYNGVVKWEKDTTIQIPAANLTGDTAFDYATGLDQTYWQETEGFPRLKHFVSPT